MRVLVMWEDESEEQEAHQLAARLIRAEQPEQISDPKQVRNWGGDLVRTLAPERRPRMSRILTRAVGYNEVMRSPNALAMDVTLGQWDGT